MQRCGPHLHLLVRGGQRGARAAPQRGATTGPLTRAQVAKALSEESRESRSAAQLIEELQRLQVEAALAKQRIEEMARARAGRPLAGARWGPARARTAAQL